MKITSARHPDKQIQPAKPFNPNDVELPGGLYLQVTAICCSCGDGYNYDGDINDFNFDMSYCGRSFRCCP
jgi:hypothetical protein